MSVGLISPIVHDVELVALLVDANGLSDALEARLPTWSSSDSRRRELRYSGSTTHPNPLPLFSSLIPCVNLALVSKLPLGFEPLHRVELGRLRRPAHLELEAPVGNMLLLGGGREVLRKQVRAILRPATLTSGIIFFASCLCYNQSTMTSMCLTLDIPCLSNIPLAAVASRFILTSFFSRGRC